MTKLTLIKFLQKSKLHPKLIAFLTFVIDELMMIGRFLYRIFMVIALAYPFRYFWNEITVDFGVPSILHIDTAIAILSIIFIVGWVFNMMKKDKLLPEVMSGLRIPSTLKVVLERAAFFFI